MTNNALLYLSGLLSAFGLGYAWGLAVKNYRRFLEML